MGFLIIKRSRAAPNLFRDILVDSIDTGIGDEVILCSGFFQENRNSTYRASREKDLARVLRKHKIKTTVIGVYNNAWRGSFNNFITSLRRSRVNVIPIDKTKKRWHAKVFILKKDGNGIFGIIGSSNLTRPAFHIDIPFNVECDVILWVDSYVALTKQIDENLKKSNINDYFKVKYVDEENQGLTIKDRLNRLEKEILSEQ
jgi:HKD family nuclease